MQRHMLPQDGIAQRSDAKSGDCVEVLRPVPMSGFSQQVAVLVTDPRDGTLQPAPDFDAGSWPLRDGHGAGRKLHGQTATSTEVGASFRFRFAFTFGSVSSIRRKVASACPTTWSML